MVQEKPHVLINNKTMKTTKNTILIIFSLLFINIACSQESPLSHVKASDISILNSANKQLSFFSSKGELIQAFDQPVLSKVMTDEDMLEYESETYEYNGINFAIENRPSNDMVINFEIKNTNYFIIYDNVTIKINDNIDNFKPLFPESFDFMNNVEKKNMLRIDFSYLDNTFIPYESELIITFDENTKLINSIMVWNNL